MCIRVCACMCVHVLADIDQCSVHFPYMYIVLFTDQLREGVQFDSSALLEIQLALYIAQEAVSLGLNLFLRAVRS